VPQQAPAASPIGALAPRRRAAVGGPVGWQDPVLSSRAAVWSPAVGSAAPAAARPPGAGGTAVHLGAGAAPGSAGSEHPGDHGDCRAVKAAGSAGHEHPGGRRDQAVVGHGSAAGAGEADSFDDEEETDPDNDEDEADSYDDEGEAGPSSDEGEDFEPLSLEEEAADPYYGAFIVSPTDGKLMLQVKDVVRCPVSDELIYWVKHRSGDYERLTADDMHWVAQLPGFVGADGTGVPGLSTPEAPAEGVTLQAPAEARCAGAAGETAAWAGVAGDMAAWELEERELRQELAEGLEFLLDDEPDAVVREEREGIKFQMLKGTMRRIEVFLMGNRTPVPRGRAFFEELQGTLEHEALVILAEVRAGGRWTAARARSVRAKVAARASESCGRAAGVQLGAAR